MVDGLQKSPDDSPGRSWFIWLGFAGAFQPKMLHDTNVPKEICPKFRSEKNGAALVSLCMWLILGCGRVWLVSVDELWCSVPSFSFRFSDLMWLDAETQHWFLRWDPKVDPWRQQTVMSKAKSTCIPVVPNSKSNFRFDGSGLRFIWFMECFPGLDRQELRNFSFPWPSTWPLAMALSNQRMRPAAALSDAFRRTPACVKSRRSWRHGRVAWRKRESQSRGKRVIQCHPMSAWIQSKNLSFSCLISMMKLLKPQQVSQHGQDTVRKNLNQTTKPQTDWSDWRVISRFSSIEHQVLVT